MSRNNSKESIELLKKAKVLQQLFFDCIAFLYSKQIIELVRVNNDAVPKIANKSFGKIQMSIDSCKR
jgi:hypothetical protein